MYIYIYMIVYIYIYMFVCYICLYICMCFLFLKKMFSIEIIGGSCRVQTSSLICRTN